MNISLVSKPVPLHFDGAGVLRVGGTRVSLDSVIAAFHDGATPEEIAQQYDALSLADVYAVISFYLDHTSDLNSYLAARRAQRAQLQQEIEVHHTPHGIRQRLLARRKQA